MKQVIFVDDHAGELICDNPKCDYVAPRGLHTFGPHLVGLPCPQCGESLLTARDYDLQNRIYHLIGRINRFFAFFGIGRESLEGYKGQTRTVGVRAVKGNIEIRPDA